MSRSLGNSGAPRWYDCDLTRFPHYLDLLEQSGATGAEIVLHDGDADEFTWRVHVLRPDWEHVVRGYRDRGLRVSIHGPLTPDFSAMRWRDEPTQTLARYQPVLAQVAEIAEDQAGATLVLHAVSDRNATQERNERATAEFLRAIAEAVSRRSSKVTLAVELRAYRGERPTAAATTRKSVMRVAEMANHPDIGVCWDVAHDLESHIALGRAWTEPDSTFLDHIRHLHLHDLGNDNEPHYPPLIGRVPISEALDLVPDVAAVMEVRWRMAERLGDPWDILRDSYREIQSSSRS